MDPAAVVTPLMLQIFNKFRVKGLPSLKFWLSFYQTRIAFMISPLTSGQVSVCTPGLQAAGYMKQHHRARGSGHHNNLCYCVSYNEIQ